MKTRYKQRRRVPVIKQRDMSECGSTCLAIIFRYYGLENIQGLLRDLAHVNADGIDLYTLSMLAEQFGFKADAYETGFEWLSNITLPCIAHYEGNHFIVVYKADEENVWFVDPAFGRNKLSREEFCQKWGGIILVLEPGPEVFSNPDVMELVRQQREREGSIRKHFYTALFRPFKRTLWEILAAGLVLQLLALAVPFLVQTMVDQAIVYHDEKLLYAILAALVVVFLARILSIFGRNILLTQFKVEFELEFFSRFFEHFIHLSQQYFDNRKREDFIVRFQENLKLRQLFSPGILETLLDSVFVLVFILALFTINTALAGIVLAFVGVFVAIGVWYTPRLHELEDKVFNENLKSMGIFLDTLLGIQTVKLLSIEQLKFWQWKRKYRQSLNKVLSAHTLSITLQSAQQSLFVLGLVAIYWLGAWFVLQGNLSIGQYIAFTALFTMIIRPLESVSRLWFVITGLMVTYHRLNDVFMQKRERADLLGQRSTGLGGDIRYSKVGFRYNAQQEPAALREIDVHIPAGSTFAVVGRNGSGKSTFVKLLLQLYSGYEGSIRWGDAELRDIHPSFLRKSIAMLPQEVYLFAGTIRENILYANPAATQAEIDRAAGLAGLDSFVRQNHLGYSYMIGESGSNLSGGEKLKLAFARLFVSNPEVVILDEASSALDLESEREIMNNVYREFRGKTIISIAHRLATVRQSQKILVFDNGRIIEQGSHTELLARKGSYFQLMRTYLEL